MSDRKKLESVIEKELYNLVRTVKEHTRDFTVLYIRKNHVPVDSDAMAATLDIVEKAIMDGFQRNVDNFLRKLDKSLSEVTKEENPLQPTQE
jgi:hypothetical protein